MHGLAWRDVVWRSLASSNLAGLGMARLRRGCLAGCLAPRLPYIDNQRAAAKCFAAVAAGDFLVTTGDAAAVLACLCGGQHIRSSKMEVIRCRLAAATYSHILQPLEEDMRRGACLRLGEARPSDRVTIH